MNHSMIKAASAAAGLALALAGCATSEAVQTTAACADQAVQIYFEPDSAEITGEGMAVLRQAAEMAKGCAIDKIEVQGLADAVGAPAANLALSEQRARAVTAALTQVGLPRADFVAASGDVGALTVDGEARPLRRRTDIRLQLSPKA